VTPERWYAKAHAVATTLQGTCMHLEQALEQHECEDLENDSAFLLELDNTVFCCETCGWWCEQSEMAERVDDRWICQECTDDE
jgi:hypothetical protein